MTKENKEVIKKIEAVLFLSARYLTTDDIVRFTGVNPLTVKEIMLELIKRYNKEDSGLTIIRQNVEGKELWKMDVRQEFHQLINKIATGESEFTKAEQETLAVIAYKKPIKQSVVVKIRGNKAYDHIKHFIEYGLVKSKKAGRTYELNVSERFYDYFNLDKEGKVEVKEKSEKEVNKENAIVDSGY
ncbi:MAG: SMC-Scp complex subunit ScpB [Candidatus Pacearchaeota archaeon]